MNKSLVALDWLNFFLSALRAGLVPYIAIYFARKGFVPSEVGIIIATLILTTACAFLPAGQLVDRYKHRRELMALAIFIVALCVLVIIFFQDFMIVLPMQIVAGIAIAFIPTTLAAISLGLVGHDHIAQRAGRNDAFNHAGNVTLALIVGVLGISFPAESILYLILLLCLISIIAVISIRRTDINENWAKGLSSTGDTQTLHLKTLLTNRNLLIFLLAVLLFFLANAALLPLVLQKIIGAGKTTALGVNSLWSSSCIIFAELVMIPFAIFTGRWAKKGRKNIFLICYVVVALRALLFSLVKEPALLAISQLLDGISAGIFGVVSLTIVSDLAYGSGRFNSSQGLMNIMCAVGASLSNYLAGIFADMFGFGTACLFFMSIAILAFVFVLKAMPETKDCAPITY